jgi:hypothetical protein
MLVCSQVEEINNYLARLFFNLEAFFNVVSSD